MVMLQMSLHASPLGKEQLRRLTVKNSTESLMRFMGGMIL